MLLRSHISARVSLSFALTGMIAAVLAHLRGDWTWLRVIQRVQQGIPAHWKVVGGIGAILLDATAMALFGGRFQLIRPDTWAMTREAVAARLTATGAVLMPGGTLS